MKHKHIKHAVHSWKLNEKMKALAAPKPNKIEAIGLQVVVAEAIEAYAGWAGWEDVTVRTNPNGSRSIGVVIVRARWEGDDFGLIDALVDELEHEVDKRIRWSKHVAVTTHGGKDKLAFTVWLSRAW